MQFLVFQHHPAEHPGCFREFLRGDGIGWDAVELEAGEQIPDIRGYDALLAFGGPMDVWDEQAYPWLVAEKEAIRRFVRDLNRPFLGVCLGHQLLASVLGGTVGKMRDPEVEVTAVRLTAESLADPIFGNLPPILSTLQWHGAEVKSLPPNSVVLATNDACAIQAMRVGKRAYGVQYHVELEDTTVNAWGQIAEYRCALETVNGPDSQLALERAAATEMAAIRTSASTLYQNFCGMVRNTRDAGRNR
jgi:GMP synthase-like glutamine amidotransferase